MDSSTNYNKLRALVDEHNKQVNTVDDSIAKDDRLQNHLDKINNFLDNTFPAYEELEKLASEGGERYYVLNLSVSGLFGNELIIANRTQSKTTTLYLDGNMYHIAHVDKTIEERANPIDGKSDIVVSAQYIFDYLKNKSVPELGVPKTVEPSFFNGTNWKIYYEW